MLQLSYYIVKAAKNKCMSLKKIKTSFERTRKSKRVLNERI